MYSFQNQFLQQLSQLTCGVATTISHSGARTSAPARTAQKIRLSQQHSPTAPQATVSSTSGVQRNEELNNLKPAVTSETTDDAGRGEKIDATSLQAFLARSQIDSNFLNANLRKKLDSTRLNKVVDELASYIVDAASSKHGYNRVKGSVIQNLKLEILKILDIPACLVNSLNFEKALQLESSYGVAEEVYFNSNRSSIRNSFVSYKSTGLFETDQRFSTFLQPQYNIYRTVPYRTFKTKRDLDAAKARNPSLIDRIRDKLFPPKEIAPPIPLTSEKLKTIIGEVPANEADKLKIAFAEGYIAANPTSTVPHQSRTYRWLRTVQQILAIAVFTAILASLMGSFGGGIFRVNVNNGNEVHPEEITVTFQDVKGVDEAKQELQEVVDFLKNPEKFITLGGKLPKGVLLVGPPGTGKTLLARAVAGEAGVPFFQAAGPEFDEILVGQGARRVRDLFKAAKLKAPCVIFIDEIDSVGSKRTNSVLHPYANQTINQLLSEMDGFRQNEGVIVLGATNRREDLDRALLRPGRFDVEVPVPAPDFVGRKDILEYYTSKVKRADDVDVDVLARGTTGFTGADLENMVNQAALKAAIEGSDRVYKKHLDFARDKVLMGPERKSRIPDDETNKITAYHEGGHALVAHYTKDANTLHKVTIIPRGQSLGHTSYIPDKEQYHVTRSQLMALMDTMMGGRAAEELIFGPDKVTSGAASDLKQATAIASHMVKEWGMSDKVGLRAIEDNSKSLVSVSDLGPNTSEQIDQEIRRLLQESYERAKNILRIHSKEHKALADALLKYETLDADDVKAILSGQTPPSPIKKDLIPPVVPKRPNVC
ncbi:unnamed protein product [Orchesella dallaii]|uniref:AAA+ ATPase domain-containing protein n=1 Tax=Orchesella dallaii TaxID=48710 RepID=A0ABP1QQJ8_9HEXA